MFTPHRRHPERSAAQSKDPREHSSCEALQRKAQPNSYRRKPKPRGRTSPFDFAQGRLRGKQKSPSFTGAFSFLSTHLHQHSKIYLCAPSPHRCHPERSAKRAVEGPARTQFVRSLATQGPAKLLPPQVLRQHQRLQLEINPSLRRRTNPFDFVQGRLRGKRKSPSFTGAFSFLSTHLHQHSKIYLCAHSPPPSS
jgi:hypothetical protein